MQILFFIFWWEWVNLLSAMGDNDKIHSFIGKDQFSIIWLVIVTLINSTWHSMACDIVQTIANAKTTGSV